MITFSGFSAGTLSVGLLALAFNLVPVALAMRFRQYVRDFPSRNFPDFSPRCSILLPCKGLDPGLKENLAAIFGQEYPDWELLCVVADETDPCLPVIREAIAAHPGVRARIVVSGHGSLCSEKNHNHLVGLRHADPDSQALVFIDSDIRPHASWLRDLVRPLGDPQFGASTGYRMIFPTDGNLASLLRSSWSMMSTAVLANDKLNGTWAGSMAILRHNFERLEIARRWEQALCDGPLVAASVKEAGLGICFVPHCVVGTFENATMPGLLEWTNRQMAIAKVYLGRMWGTAFISYGLPNFFLLMSLVLLTMGLFRGQLDPAIFLLLTHAPLTWLMGAIMLGALRDAVPENAEHYRKLPLAYLLAMPLTSLLGLVNVVASIPTNRITWRGVTYEMDAPDRIRVVERRKIEHVSY